MHHHTILAIALAASAGLASAQSADHSHHVAPAAAAGNGSSAATATPTEAEVRKLDRAAGKVTLKHGAIPNLDMPPMTMVFEARDMALLNGLKAGDKVRFTADRVNGAFVLRSIEATP
ncbi:copper-binding protein [Hydrogenophaga palleronii]|uniref:copper-binding protein n=1 Tax=Hydrogenophaga palleronii TaxID=65655 RepID=UPI0008246612|nr:copper-binding protein [Hydrogenophaga palleronii]